MVQYKIVNPYVEGEFDRIVSATKKIDAANKAWNSLSKYMNNEIPQFGFSLQNVSNDSIYHFVVNEKYENDGVKYDISEKKLKNDSIKSFLNDINKFNEVQQGGSNSKRYKNYDGEDDDNIDFDEDDILDKDDYHKYKKMYERIKKQKNAKNKGIVYWWYNPLIYKLDSVFIPTFISSVTPYIQLHLQDLYSY